MDVKALIREVPDFPKPGINFKDITTLLKDGEALRFVVKSITERFRPRQVDLILGVESRGFAIGSPVAYDLEKGFVLARKPGKLPAQTVRVDYELEYGTDALEIHRDSVKPGDRVLLVDDLLATGGTMAAAGRLVQLLGGEIAGFGFIIELAFLKGRDKLAELGNHEVFSLVSYEQE